MATGKAESSPVVVVEQDAASAPEQTPPASMVQRLKIVLLTEQRVKTADLREMCEPCTDLRFGIALHRAREEIRAEHSVEFVAGAKGELVRATEAQKVTKGVSFGRTATLKRRRAGRILAAVDPSQLTDDERNRLQLATDKTRQLLAWEEQLSRKRA